MSQKPEANTNIHLPKKITTSPCHYLGELHKIPDVLWNAAASETEKETGHPSTPPHSLLTKIPQAQKDKFPQYQTQDCNLE